MSYLFRCDFCDREIEFDPFLLHEEFERVCQACGQLICLKCQRKGLCLDCFDSKEEE